MHHAIAAGMAVHVGATLRWEVAGAGNVGWEPGTLLVATHRSERDVPLVCSALYFRGGLWRNRGRALSFAARDDMFAAGFLAGFPPGLPPWLRGRLARLSLERGLRHNHVHPIASATTIRLGAALAAVPPDAALDELLPAAVLGRLRTVAAYAGRPEPRSAGDALRGELMDALWAPLTTAELTHPAFEPAWRRRATEARGSLRELIEVMRAGHPLLLFPEGRPSPDGAVGPLRRGLGALARRGGARRLVPIGVAYDALTVGRPRAVVALRPAVAADGEGIEDRALSELRRALPLTCAGAVAPALLALAEAGERRLDPAALERAVAEAVKRARSAGRPVERALIDTARHRPRLAECLAALARSGALVSAPDGASTLEPALVLSHPELRRAATAERSAAEG
ncbi:MAG: Acyltransferase [Miltoncostaeaceae bacterium]|nr:Acyltransferase [Miltoncostaeaceae bacterium]